MATDPLLGIDEVAELLHVPVSWVYERTRKRGINRIPGFRLGKYWRFRKADVLAWLATIANVAGVDLDAAVRKKYGSGCPGCGQFLCQCDISEKP